MKRSNHKMKTVGEFSLFSLIEIKGNVKKKKKKKKN